MARVLIAENHYLIGQLLQELLRDLHFEPVACVPSVAQAIELVRQRQFDIALLDVMLDDGRSDPVADALIASRIPFAFTTGSDSGDIAARFAGVPMVSKPYGFEALAAALATLLQPARG